MTEEELNTLYRLLCRFLIQIDSEKADRFDQEGVHKALELSVRAVASQQREVAAKQ